MFLSKINSSAPLALMVVMVVFASHCSSPVSAAPKFKYCKFDYLWECFAEPISYFTSQPNGTGIANTEAEMDQYCFNAHDYFSTCVKQWVSRCGSTMHSEIIRRVLVEPLQQSITVFCDTKGKIRPVFLKHSTCLIREVKLSGSYRNECVRNLQADTEFVQMNVERSLNGSAFVHNTCCTYNRWQQCIVRHLTEKCSPEAGEVFPYLIHHTSMDVLRSICPVAVMDPEDSEKCNPKETRAPKDFVPSGLKSKNLFSYFFSYLCPNVGFGVDEE